ncbi:hypothetical protein [Lacticaseibacillus sharpeae]|uniref:Uncharacterized protein n=1 Tax=Lacticaseibacillus sharpeae JCM 1186 = DSM 20505 TaxID=1291052 RepID=A0A0R1ZJ99_9LACO|nr:hypothetical protein [Lacticaseibacillus sharpeae]KRM55038.1 hypothetical protein FC18_GL001746 [Lacticaseibacillus sharpeae JCM 1186 = DSM 20505]
MIYQFIFELKHTSKYLLLFLLALITLSIMNPITYELTSEHYGDYFGLDGYQPVNGDWHNTTKDALLTSTLKQAESDQARVDYKTWPASVYRADIRHVYSNIYSPYLKHARKLLRTKQFQKFNRLTWGVIDHHFKTELPPINTIESQLALVPNIQYRAISRIFFPALLKWAPNKLTSISTSSDATNLITPTMIGYGSNDTHKEPLVPPLVILACAVVLIATMFSNGAKTNGRSFERTVPLGEFRVLLTRGLTAMVLLDGLVLCAYAIVLVGIALLPGHDLGSFMFPQVFYIHSDFIVRPLIAVYGQALLYYTAWFCQIAAVAVVVSLWSQNAIVSALVLAIDVFASYMGFMNIIPANITALIPAQFTNLGALLQGVFPYGAISWYQAPLVMAGWSVVLLLGTWQILKVRKRV